jgi:hypothetical protein
MREYPSTFVPWEPSRADLPAPPAELTVREATAQDIEGCVALAELVSDGSNVDWSELFRHNIEHSDRYLMVAKAGDELIGYGRTAWFEPDPAAPPNAAPAGYTSSASSSTRAGAVEVSPAPSSAPAWRGWRSDPPKPGTSPTSGTGCRSNCMSERGSSRSPTTSGSRP